VFEGARLTILTAAAEALSSSRSLTGEIRDAALAILRFIRIALTTANKIAINPVAPPITKAD
jgi:hypothetical protein